MSLQIRPKYRNALAGLIGSLVVGQFVVMAASPGVLADQLTTPPAPTASEQANRPARGMSMERVEAIYGAPIERLPAVGEPPITRWKYPGFEVYFEHHLVIHTVGIS